MAKLHVHRLQGVKERWVRVNGLRTRVLDGGKGPPVVFLHGVGGWAENWREILPVVARWGHRVLACDLPGFGDSEAAPVARYFDRQDSMYVAFVRGLLAAFGLRRVSLVGHSMGGTIAAMFAASEPGAVRQMVLAAPGGFGESVSARLRLLALPICQPLSRYVPAAVVQDFLRANFHDPRRIPQWLLEEARRYGPRSGAEMSRVLAQALAFGRQSARLRAQWCEQISQVRCRTLIVWGNADRALPSAHLDRAREVLPHAETLVIPDAGHLVMIERREEFLGALRRFVRQAGMRRGQPIGADRRGLPAAASFAPATVSPL